MTAQEAAERWVTHGAFIRTQSVNWLGLTFLVLLGPVLFTTPHGNPAVKMVLTISRQSNGEVLTRPFGPLDPEFGWIIPTVPDGLTVNEERQFLLGQLQDAIKAHADRHGIVV